MSAIVTPVEVVDCFKNAINTWGVSLPLKQAEVKPVVAIAVISLTQTLGLKHPMYLSANNKKMLRALRKHAGTCAVDPYESLLDLTVYAGKTDPFDTLFTAESEAYSQHPITPSSGSDDSDYLWDLFKLLQVWSPHRLFVARIVEARRSILENRVDEFVRFYGAQIPVGHRVFSLVLPASLKQATPIVCYGWESTPGGMVQTTPASAPL